jgi:hypothetical protein
MPELPPGAVAPGRNRLAAPSSRSPMSVLLTPRRHHPDNCLIFRGISPGPFFARLINNLIKSLEETPMMTLKKGGIGVALFMFMAGNAHAVPFTEVRVGDEDGFGYNNDPNFSSLTGDGGAADRDGNGGLNPGDVLPSLNGNDTVALYDGDDFDNRSGEGVNGQGFVDNGTQGTEYTDISLSVSYDDSAAAGNVYDANTGTSGTGGAFPEPPANVRSNPPGFVFDFSVADADIAAGTDIFFNMVFGDYDVTPAQIDFTYGSGVTETLGVSAQNNGPNDGLIQGAFSTLDFSDVFTANGTNWDGYLEVDFVAPNEPYTAFDYVELSVDPLVVPEPGAWALMILGMGGLAFAGGRRRPR